VTPTPPAGTDDDDDGTGDDDNPPPGQPGDNPVPPVTRPPTVPPTTAPPTSPPPNDPPVITGIGADPNPMGGPCGGRATTTVTVKVDDEDAVSGDGSWSISQLEQGDGFSLSGKGGTFSGQVVVPYTEASESGRFSVNITVTVVDEIQQRSKEASITVPLAACTPIIG
jgi:putative peptide zinc metalloprotease protein